MENGTLAGASGERGNDTTLQRRRIRNSSGSRQSHLEDGAEIGVEGIRGRRAGTDDVDQKAQNDATLGVGARSSECNDNDNVSGQRVGRWNLAKLSSDGSSSSLSIKSVGQDLGGRWIRGYRISCNGRGGGRSANVR